MYAYDTETTDIIEDRPDLTPDLVIGSACNGKRGVYLTRDMILPFFQAHADVAFICTTRPSISALPRPFSAIAMTSILWSTRAGSGIRSSSSGC